MSVAWDRLNLSTEEGRERALARLDRLRALVRPSNREVGFAELRDADPEVAAMLFTGVNIRNVDLRGSDLQRIDFRGSDLSGSRFDGARICGARFEMAKVARDALRGAADWDDYIADWEPIPPEEQVAFRRLALERFSVSPLLPEFTLLPADLETDRFALPVDEARSLEAGRLAVSLRCIDAAGWSRVVEPYAPHLSPAPVSFPWHAARTFLLAVERRGSAVGLPVGVKLALPSAGLALALANCGSSGSAEAARSTDTDLDVSALGIAEEGLEYVHIGGADEIGAIGFEDALDRQESRLEIKPSTPDRALLRPVMHLAE